MKVPMILALDKASTLRASTEHHMGTVFPVSRVDLGMLTLSTGKSVPIDKIQVCTTRHAYSSYIVS